jgi:hypothetical protein
MHHQHLAALLLSSSATLCTSWTRRSWSYGWLTLESTSEFLAQGIEAYCGELVSAAPLDFEARSGGLQHAVVACSLLLCIIDPKALSTLESLVWHSLCAFDLTQE